MKNILLSQKAPLQLLANPLSFAILASLSSLVQANTENNIISLAPLVSTAVTSNSANGLLVIADPKQPIQPIPAQDGSAYLQSIVGFNQIRNGGAQGDVTFRGMFGSRLKVLTDGTENLGACPMRMDNPASYIAPENFDRITVVKGPQTVRYANSASAATINFERVAEKFNTEKNARAQASVLVGSFGRLDNNLEAAAGNEQAYLRVNANHTTSNSYQDGNGERVPSDWNKWNTDLTVGVNPSPNSNLELKVAKGDAEVVYAGRDVDGSQFKRESLGLSYEVTGISDVLSNVTAQIDWTDYDHIMDNFSLRTPPMTSMMGGMSVADRREMRVTRDNLNSTLAATLNWDALSLTTGLNTQYNKHGGDMKRSSMPSMNRPFQHDYRFESYGAFAELGFQANDNNRYVSGLRFDRARAEQLLLQQTRNETLPSAFIRWENDSASADVKSYIGLGYVERLPDYWEIRTTFDGMGSSFDRLNNEQTTQLDMGIQAQFGAVNAWTSAYIGQIDNYILVRYSLAGMGGMAMGLNAAVRNVDARIAGAEAGLGYHLSDAIQADISAMYAYAENTTDNRALPQIAPLEARVNLRYVQERYNLGLLWRVVAAQDRTSFREGNIIGYDVADSTGFGVLSVNGAFELNPAINLSVGVDNVLNKAYAEHLNKLGSSGFGFAANEQFNNPGRNYWARVQFKY